jgi:hypothetical protein
MKELSVIAQRLESNVQAARIKKLLLYATTGHWETNAHKLQYASTQPMLNQLHRLYPTTHQLRFYLYTIAANLTKPREYQQLANIVLLECAGLYTNSGGEDDEPTAFFSSQPMPPPPVAINDEMMEEQCQIAQTLELMAERNRIVKLMLCLLYNTWESDAEKIARTSIHALLQAIQQKYTSLIEVERQLIAIVQRLSKAMEYSPLATTIVQQITPLYDFAQDDPAAEQAWASLQSLDGFNVRLEVMKFANPLRAKILLFSLLHHPFRDSDEDWAVLRRCSLESLLKQVLEINTATDLGFKLVQMAQTLPQAEEYEPVVEVLIRALQLPIVPTESNSAHAEAGEATQLRLTP